MKRLNQDLIKKLVIIRATNLYKYVDQNIVKVSEKSFNTIVEELRMGGYLIEIGSDNPYGLNRFDITDKAEVLLALNRNKAIKALGEISGLLVGTAFGAGMATYENLKI